MTTISLTEASVDADREFWRGVLTGGGFTAIPRWTAAPVPGVAGYEAPVPGLLLPALRQRAAESGVPLSSVLLAAHAKVLAELSGEATVMTGYLAAARGRPLPCRLAVSPGPWRAVLRETHRAEWELLAHQDYPVGDLVSELGLPEPPFETVFDSAGGEGTLAPDTVLWVSVWPQRGRLVLRLRYRTDVLDAGAAARIAGYHLTALEQIAADPGARHDQQSLLSPDEFRFQLDGLAGPDRDRPWDRRVHELFEQRVRAHPDAVAAVHGGWQWSYAELNARANRLGRALLARGLRREGVVAVVTERNLDWMAAVLAIFKAGGVYLPIEPHFPADRIAAVLSRAGCELVLTEPGSTATLGPALASRPGTEALFAATAYAEDHADDDLGLEVGPDQLAYIYFTSGSTGAPKGAMCEHAGMLNHLYAKIEDLQIGPGQAVAQTAPQCFDISLWQLISALLAGGRTLIVEQLLDVGRFLDEITEARVSVLQLVPSYLEVLLTYLDRSPRELPDLRYVSVTGEALKLELAQRWFAARPGIKLVNAYGLTETSDDTNHEVMDRAPDGDRVPLGRPVANVRVYVVDANLRPVPLGAAGLIAFSGVCVGRGYINDPERTAQAYLTDPYREGQRLYLGGDYGRWRPDGKLEFLGRRDSQVKISGFRIEIGEVENALLRVPGVRDGAVVVAPGQRLVAFYRGPQPIETAFLRDRLGASLPWYMVPAAFHWREALPLTANSKIDTKALTALAGQLGADSGADYDAPRTPAEQRLAAAWAAVLGLSADGISRHDNFFDRGGSSLLAVKLAIALDRAVSLKGLTRHPVLADMAGLIDAKSGANDKTLTSGKSLAGRKEPQRAGLLQPLLEQDGGPALVCFPYAGGNAVNFQAMAARLRGSGLSVYAVELPGHDLGGPAPDAEDEPFASLPQVVAQVADEIAGRGLTGVLLWGHSSGAAFAVATAAELQARGTGARRVFLAAQLPGDAAARRASVTELTSRSDADIAARLSADGGYTELADLDAQRSGQVGAAYRHDCVSAHRYLANALDGPAMRLSAPVTVVAAADDPSTADPAGQHRDWAFITERVDLHEIAEGGHYFLRTRPAEAAQAVLRTLEREN
jgi:amino acid adenylation domain-containing protein